VGSAAALIGGYLTEKEGTQLVFIYLAVIMFIALLFTVLMKRISK
jgi:predicted MFS family arabinose efflux permease